MYPKAEETPILLDQHALFAGTTGAGKTVRAAYQLAWRWREVLRVPLSRYLLLVVDTKPVGYGGDDAIGNFAAFTRPPYNAVVIRNPDLFDPNAAAERASRMVIYRPEPDLVRPDVFGAWFERLAGLRYVADSGRTEPLGYTLYIDEIIDVFSEARTRTAYLHGFSRIMTQGRAALQTVWLGTQYLAYLDSTILRLTTARFVFRLGDQRDRDRIAKNTGYAVLRRPIPDVHGFWYLNDNLPGRNVPEYYDGIV